MRFRIFLRCRISCHYHKIPDTAAFHYKLSIDPRSWDSNRKSQATKCAKYNHVNNTVLRLFDRRLGHSPPTRPHRPHPTDRTYPSPIPYSIQRSAVQCSAVQSSPVQSNPVQPSPIQHSSELQCAPMQSGPVQPGSVQPSPTRFSPVQFGAAQSNPVLSSAVWSSALRCKQSAAEVRMAIQFMAPRERWHGQV